MDNRIDDERTPSFLTRIIEGNSFWFLLFFLFFFTSQMTFRGSDIIAGGTTDIQVFVRLGVLAGTFCFMLFYYKRFFLMLREIPIFFHLMLLTFLLIVTVLPHAFSFYSLYCLATNFMMFYVVVLFVDRLGTDKALYYYACGVAVFCLVGMIIYYLMPGIGRYWYWNEAGVFYQSTRMSGIAGHPNTLGFMAATGILSFLHLVVQRYKMSRLLYAGMIIVFACLLLTDSRTSLFGAILMSGIYLVLYLRMTWLAVLMGVLAVVFLLLSLEFSWGIVENILLSVSRSGSIEEVTSLTGRSSIWDQVVIFIEKRPIIGHGHATMSTVLSEHKDKVGFEVGQAHNIYLQMLFAGGFVGFFIYIAGILSALVPSIIISYHKRYPFMTCIIFYIILTGFTETIILSTVANNAYFVFILGLAGVAVESRNMRR